MNGTTNPQVAQIYGTIINLLGNYTCKVYTVKVHEAYCGHIHFLEADIEHKSLQECKIPVCEQSH